MRPLDQALVMCSRGHQVVTAIRRLQPFRYLHDCSDCFRLERIAGWALHPLESAAFSRRTPSSVIQRHSGPIFTTLVSAHQSDRTHGPAENQSAFVFSEQIMLVDAGLATMSGNLESRQSAILRESLPAALRDRKFADSLLEGTGFEPSVPAGVTLPPAHQQALIVRTTS